MYYWRFRRSLLTPGFDRKVNEHQRLCTSVQGLFSFLYRPSPGRTADNGVMVLLFWSEIAELASNNCIFHINPQFYIWWCHQARVIPLKVRANYGMSDHSRGYYVYCNEVMRVKIRSRQKLYLQSTLAAQVWAQRRCAARNRSRF